MLRPLLVALLALALAAPLLAQGNEEEAQQYLSIAQKYLRRGDFSRAEEYAERVLAVSPGNLSAKDVLDRARARAQSFVDDEAAAATPSASGPVDEAALLRQWREAPDEAARREPGARLAEAFLERSQDLARRGGEPAEVLLCLRKAELANGENPWVHYEFFTVLQKLGRLEEAAPHGARFLALQGFGAIATEVRRKLAEVEMAVGDRCVKESRWDKCVPRFRAVLGLDPDQDTALQARRKLALAYVTLYQQLEGRSQPVEAAEYLDGLMSLRPAADPDRAAFDLELYGKVRRTAAAVLWEAAKLLKARNKPDRAAAMLDRLAQADATPQLRQEAQKLRLALVDVQTGQAPEDLAPIPPPSPSPLPGATPFLGAPPALAPADTPDALDAAESPEPSDAEGDLYR